MSTVSDRGVIDNMVLEKDGTLALCIVDHLPWDYCVREQHARILQDKINDYLQFIDSGEIAAYHKAEEYNRIAIRIIAKYSYSQYCLDFFERVQNWVKENGGFCELTWTHLSPQDGEETEFQDGFSDDYVFVPEKVYPRIKKNWAKNPLEAVTIMASDNDFNNGTNGETSEFNNVPMFRIMDSYVITLLQDMGSTYMYLSYENIPQEASLERLQQQAFENLQRDITYRMVESKVPEVYGIIAGGDFEAESLCLTGIWADCSEKLQDDLLIAVPTKDVVLFTKASDKKAIRKMIKLAQENLKRNQKESPALIFSPDIFYYNWDTKLLVISKKYKI